MQNKEKENHFEMSSWMQRLSRHYERMRGRHPDDEVMILFDIDGTILDSRYMIHHTLQSYDRANGTDWFADLAVEDVTASESQVEQLLESMGIHSALQEGILAWYTERCWTQDNILRSHRPFAGVMDVIRWFEIQPRTHVGLNTGRPEQIRQETLLSLNNIGREYKVRFLSEHLFMNRRGWNEGILEEKAEGIRHFQGKGYRVIAFVDNEPENLQAVAELGNDEILLLHARTIFRSRRDQLPLRTVEGRAYDITDLVPEKSLPRHVQFVWHGVNDEANLRQFMASAIEWAECDVRFDPDGERVILRNDSFRETPPDPDETFIRLENILEKCREGGKSLKLDLKENGHLLDRVLTILRNTGMPTHRVWFNGTVEMLQKEGFRKLSEAFPGSVIQCPVDFLVPLIIGAPTRALSVLDTLHGWGINRFSVNWRASEKHDIIDRLEKWGYELNIYNVPDLEAFLKAVVLLPRSVTSDFNFPKWHYYGRGPGPGQRHFEYSIVHAPEIPAF